MIKQGVDMFICGKFVWRETTLNRGIIGRFINEKTHKRDQITTAPDNQNTQNDWKNKI